MGRLFEKQPEVGVELTVTGSKTGLKYSSKNNLKVTVTNPVNFEYAASDNIAKIRLVELVGSEYKEIIPPFNPKTKVIKTLEYKFETGGNKTVILEALDKQNNPTQFSAKLNLTVPPPVQTAGIGATSSTTTTTASSQTLTAIAQASAPASDPVLPSAEDSKVEIIYPPKPKTTINFDNQGNSSEFTSYFLMNKGDPLKIEFKAPGFKKVQFYVNDSDGSTNFVKYGDPVDVATKSKTITFNVPGLRAVKVVGLLNSGKESSSKDEVKFEVKDKTILEFINPANNSTPDKKVTFIVAWNQEQKQPALLGLSFYAEGNVFGGTDKSPVPFNEYDPINKRWIAQFIYDFKEFNKKRIITAKTVASANFIQNIETTITITPTEKPKQKSLEELAQEQKIEELPKDVKEAKSLTEVVLEEFSQKLKEQKYAIEAAYNATYQPIVLTNTQNYDLSRLRFTENVKNEEGLLNDPIALMTNEVWDHYAFNENAIAFKYRNSTMEKYASQATIVNAYKYFKSGELSKLLFTSKYTSPDLIENAFNKGELNKKERNGKYDYFMMFSINEQIKKKLQEDGYKIWLKPEAQFAYFWSWIKHIFSKNVEIMQDNPDPNVKKNTNKKRIRLIINPNNYLLIQFALYYLEIKYGISGANSATEEEQDLNENSYNLITTWQNKLNSGDLSISEKVFDYAFKENRKFINKNNYTISNKKPSLSLNTIVQIDNSAFFAQNNATLSPGELEVISNVKKVKACKDVPTDKKETSLRLFYKEGNDNILDKSLPSEGVGCSSKLKEWSQSQTILFDAASLYPPRLNFTLPYMNDITVVGKDTIPKELDIHDIVIKDSTDAADNFKALATYLIKDKYIDKKDGQGSLILSSDDYLVDNSINQSKLTTGFKNSYNSDTFKGFKGKAIDKNSKYKYDPTKNPNWAEEYSPYLGAFNFGYEVSKTSKSDQDSKQRYFINLFANKNTKLPANLDSNTPYNYNDQNIRIYDSQIKYATGYTYTLSSLNSYLNIEYGYTNFVKTTFASSSKAELEKLLKEKGKKILELTPLVPDDLLTEFLEIANAAAVASTAEKKRYYYFDYELSGKKYINSVEIDEITTVDSGVSYIDLPPTPLLMRVYPLRGVNNKILLNFDNYSFKKGVIKEKIPKKYWGPDWEKTKKFFVESFGDLNEDQKKFYGIDVNEKPAPDEMYFTRTSIEKIQIYYTEGERPKDLLEMKKFSDPIKIAEQGFTKQIDLQPNTKYYFSAKAISFLGLESDYSQVYEIELVDADGAVFTTVDIVDLSEKENKRKSKMDLNKKFRIEPALLQQAPNPLKNQIGYLNPSVFSSKDETKTQFKVRLTSKKTGRKVDFNIIYKQNLVKGDGLTAGKLSLFNATKDNVLISYTDEGVLPAAVADLLAQPSITEEELDIIVKAVTSGISLNRISKGSTFVKDKMTLISKNLKYTLKFQGDGNLVLYDDSQKFVKNGKSKALWATNTKDQGEKLVFQSDGNIVIYNKDGAAAWSSGTENTKAAELVLTDQGSLIVFSSEKENGNAEFFNFNKIIKTLFNNEG